MPAGWQRAIIVLLGKSDRLCEPSEFRPVALLTAEHRLFFILMNWRLSNYTIQNGYIDTQCFVSWIDLANAYRSVRHFMILLTLEWYHVPP